MDKLRQLTEKVKNLILSGYWWIKRQVEGNK